MHKEIKYVRRKKLFSEHDKEVYQKLADSLDTTLEVHCGDIIMNNSSDVESQLSILLSNSELEDKIQSNKKLLGCFLKNEVVCNNNIIKVSIVKEFYDFFSKLSNEQKGTVLNHLVIRFGEKDIIRGKEEDFPF